MIQLCQNIEPVQEQILIPDPLADEVLIKTAKLVRQEKLWKQLQVRLPKPEVEYHSRTDHVLCELFPEYKPCCKSYYSDSGPKLKEILTEVQIRTLDRNIVCLIRAVTRTTKR